MHIIFCDLKKMSKDFQFVFIQIPIYTILIFIFYDVSKNANTLFMMTYNLAFYNFQD